MKFRFKYLLLISLAFILGLNKVSAKEIQTSDIEKNTYVIGTHMFTRNTNENYNGQLTIKLIMLAARTIDSDDIADMVIYYKNARGKWIDGVSGEELSAPEVFDIDYTDMQKEIETPMINTVFYGFGCSEETGCTTEFGIKINNITEDIEEIELYKVVGEQYQLEDTITKENYDINTFEHSSGYINISLSEEEYTEGVSYAVRLKRGNHYSDYSNIVEIKDVEIKVIPELTSVINGFGCSEEIGELVCQTSFGLKINNIPEDIEEIELYRVIDGQYTKVLEMSKEEYDANVIGETSGYIMLLLPQEEYTEGVSLAVRLKKGDGYSYYSNIVEIKDSE